MSQNEELVNKVTVGRKTKSVSLTVQARRERRKQQRTRAEATHTEGPVDVVVPAAHVRDEAVDGDEEEVDAQAAPEHEVVEHRPRTLRSTHSHRRARKPTQPLCFAAKAAKEERTNERTTYLVSRASLRVTMVMADVEMVMPNKNMSIG